MFKSLFDNRFYADEVSNGVQYDHVKLTIRNLTTEDITISQDESSKLEAGLSAKSTPSNSHGASTINADTKHPTEDAVSIHAGAFGSTEATFSLSTPHLTLAISTSNHYTLSIPLLLPCPPPYSNSTILSPLSITTPSSKLLAIHHPAQDHLTILPLPSNHARWLTSLPDSTSLSALSIPGTHNSPAYHSPSLPAVRCQVVDVAEQLERGVRFLDVRVQVGSPRVMKEEVRNGSSGDEEIGEVRDGGKWEGGERVITELSLVHGAFPVRLFGGGEEGGFAGLWKVVRTFLRANPGEMVMMSVKREGVGKGTDWQLAEVLWREYVEENRNMWWIQDRVPSLGEARGKAVLIRRFGVPNGLQLGLDANCWPDNKPVCVKGRVCVQDWYEVGGAGWAEKKIDFCCAHIERAAAECLSTKLFFNFLSAANFWRWECWPDRIAKKLNPAILAYLCQTFDQDASEGIGIVICDMVGKDDNWDLVDCIIGANARLMQ